MPSLNQFLVSGSMPPPPSSTPHTMSHTMSHTISSNYKRPIIFSDVDGTLVQYEDKEDDEDLDADEALKRSDFLDSLVSMPATSTGKVGYISPRTLELLCRIKEEYDGYVCLVSGARTSTLAQRAPFFVHEGRSAIDAFSSESGGRLFVNKNEENDLGLFEELTFYGERHDLAPLSSLKAKLREANFVVDDRDYTHQFRLRRSKQENDAMKAAFDELLVKSETGVEGVSKTANLGCSDFFPSTSGKRSIGAFLASKMRELNEISGTAGKKRLCVFTCGDDDNDVELAKGDFVDFSIFPKKNGARVKAGEVEGLVQIEEGEKLNRFSFTGRDVEDNSGRKAWEQLREDIFATERMLVAIIDEIEK